MPIITLVLNISGEKWDGCQSIHELLSVKKEQILRYVPDYRLNLLSPDLLTEEEFDKFRTGLGAAMQFIKHQNDEDMSWMENKGSLNVDRATADFLQAATGTRFEIDENDEVIDMCKAWKNSMAQAKANGKAESKAEEQTSTALDMLKDNEPMEKIIKYSHLSKERIEELALQLNNGTIPVPST